MRTGVGSRGLRVETSAYGDLPPAAQLGGRERKSPLKDAEASRAAGGKGHGWFAILLRNLRRAQQRVHRRSVCTVIAADADSRRRQWPSDDPGRASLRVLSKANSLNATSPVFVVLSLGISYSRTHAMNLAHVSTHQFCAGFARISRVDSSQFGSDQFSSSQRQTRSTSARGGGRTAMSSAWCGTHLPTGLQRERHSHRGDDGRVLQNNTAAAGSAIRNEQPTRLNRVLHVVQNVQPLIPTPSPTPKPCTRNRSAFTH